MVRIKTPQAKSKYVKATPKNTDVAVSVTYDYPLFCFKYLSDTSIKECRNASFFKDFLLRLQKLSTLGWAGIRASSRHSFGKEKIPVGIIKPKLPVCVTSEVKELEVFRANGNNLPFVGIQHGGIFRVFFIETDFGDIYDHD